MKETLFSPAKVNLFFRILSKRDDGFHEIATLMQAISLGDEIEIEITKGVGKDTLSASDKTLPIDRSNLILKAVDLFRNQVNPFPFHVTAYLIKQIPIQAGLGGGSSNAATTLHALNKLTQANLSLKSLQNLAAEIGSDVPFFFSKGVAKCLGRGEKIYDAKNFSNDAFWIIKPKALSLSTPSVYQNCKPNVYSNKPPEEFFQSFEVKKPLYQNELEYGAFKVIPDLKSFKEMLLDYGFTNVTMTGSGSAFLATGEPKKELPDNLWIKKVHPILRDQDSWYQKTSTPAFLNS